MAKDFTLNTYRDFLLAIKEAGYSGISYLEQIQNPREKFVILRHDVDKKPSNSLKTAQLQSELGLTGTYYFRCVNESYQPDIIRAIADLGHEIGYHYEDLSLMRGDVDKAITHFEKWLEKLRKFYPVKTICMHGSPLSPIDNREIWKSINYRTYDVIAEPYFDLNFDEVLYITDTGRSWNKTSSSVRDKVETPFNFKIDSTQHLTEMIRQNQLPEKIMQNIHPQRWSNSNIEWTVELVGQNMKNVVKRLLYVKK